MPPRLARASRSALSSLFSLVVYFFLPFWIFYSRSIARSVTITGFGINIQSLVYICAFGTLGTSAASVPSIPVLSYMTLIVILNIA